MLEDREGAIAYGFIAPRVFYARFVGSLSAELGSNYVRRLEVAFDREESLAYFGDASALRAYDLVARTRFQSFVASRREKLASLVLLTWAAGIGPATRALTDALGQPLQIYSDPVEFDRALSNVAPVPARSTDDLVTLWEIHVPR